MQTLELKKLKEISFNDDVMIFVIEDSAHAVKVLDISMSEWVLRACDGFSVATIPCKEFVLDDIKPYLTNSKFTVILSAGLILLQPNDVRKMIDYIIFKNISACKLPNGYAFNTRYLLENKNIFFDSVYVDESEDFISADGKSKMDYLSSILQDRIIEKHIKNGATISGQAYIGADVVIGKDVMIFDGNVLKGNTFVADGVILKEKNVIENSEIGKEGCVSGSTIVNSTIEENVYIKPYCYIEDSLVRKNSLLSSGVELINRKTRAGAKINKKEE